MFAASAAPARPEDAARLATATGLTAPSGAVPRSRVAILTEIAERYSELVEPLNGPQGIRGDGSSPIQMPRTYTTTVREFERLVLSLRAEDRRLWAHLDGWWLSASTRTIWLCPRCGPCHQAEHVHTKRHGHGLLIVKCKRAVQWSRLPGAHESEAKRAIIVIAGWWNLRSEPMLPDEIRIR